MRQTTTERAERPREENRSDVEGRAEEEPEHQQTTSVLPQTPTGFKVTLVIQTSRLRR